MENNEFRGIILNTPEFFAKQQQLAINGIGGHLLVAARYQKGVAIGHKFNKLQNDPAQWIKQINPTSIVAGWGDWGHFGRLSNFIHRQILDIKEDLTEDYVTNADLLERASIVLESASRASFPYAVTLLFLDLAEDKHTILHFDGKIFRRSQFAVLGGYSYQNMKQLADETEVVLSKHGIVNQRFLQNLPFQVAQELDEAYARSMKNPLKDALRSLERVYGTKDFLDTQQKAVNAVKNVLFKNDPPAKNEMFEITLFEEGNLKSIYASRRTKKLSYGLSDGDIVFEPEAELDKKTDSDKDLD